MELDRGTEREMQIETVGQAEGETERQRDRKTQSYAWTVWDTKQCKGEQIDGHMDILTRNKRILTRHTNRWMGWRAGGLAGRQTGR